MSNDLADTLSRGEAAAAEGRWAEAGDCFMSGMELARATGQGADALRAARSAADAFRRDDRPAASLAALRAALEMEDDAGARKLDQAQVVAALVDAGHLDLAAKLGDELLQGGLPRPLMLLSADILCSALVLRGDIIGLRGLVARIEEEARGVAVLAARFRRAQLDRLDGRLEEAAAGFAACAGQMQEVNGGEGAAAAALVELAELCVDRGDLADVSALFDEAEGLWETAGRRAGLFSVEAGRAMQALMAGATTFLPGLLDTCVAYAEDRGLPLLEARLRLVRGLCRHASGSQAAWADLDASILLADTAGAPFLAGRARLERFRSGLGEDIDDLKKAVEQLTGNQVWWARAAVTQAEATRDTEPAEAIRLAAMALCRFEAMGLSDEADAARVLVGGG